jgi:hypothetical protein
MRTLIFTSLLLSFLSCSKEVTNPCAIEKFNNASYIGPVRLCDSINGQLVEFDGKADITLIDTIFTIHFFSIDSTFSIDQIISASSQCDVFEGYVSHQLFTLDNPADLGSISDNGHHLILEFPPNSCPEVQFFYGTLQP